MRFTIHHHPTAPVISELAAMRNKLNQNYKVIHILRNLYQHHDSDICITL